MKYIKKTITRVKIYMFMIISRILCMVLKMKENRILFLSDVRDVLDGNLKFIYDMLEDEKCEKVLSLKKDRKAKRKIKEKLKLVYYLATSKYVLLDDYSRMISIMKVRKGQEVCQLWHGAGAFKKFGYSRQDKTKSWKDKINGHRNYTKAMVSADQIRWCYAEGFGMDIENVKATGMARTDIFFNQEYIRQKREELYQEYPYLKDKKVILFAPTYRGVSLKHSYYDYEELDVEKIYQEFANENYIFLFKWHPGHYYQMQKQGIIPYDLEKYENFFYDFSDKRDINELLLITDVLITDYSSVIFDYALLNKPVVYFVYDYDVYQQDRGLYFELEDYIYGDIAKTSEELIDAIQNAKVLEDKRETFMKKFMSKCDGNATRNTCEWIFENNLDFIKEKVSKQLPTTEIKR